MTSTPSTTPANEPLRRDLSRFHEAQEGRGEGSSFAIALEEIRNGRKKSHWIWYVFPQLPLGSSSMSRKYAIADADEARAYLRDNILRDRLLVISQEVRDHLRNGVHPRQVMGSGIDCEKLSSSITLFCHVLRGQTDLELSLVCDEVAGLLAAFELNPCDRTLELLSQSHR